ncbi:MAG: tagatose-bisphosphate aldolase [Chloroflexi bacterium CG07_land_8_20_14_0_80_45_17]|nr:MAG: tagatose-bisphosphate aldolase [Chloroflexi bacterium CG23_combo_of_CG06-09_8_20_14_all_45_10]PIU56091.1 MAG: tagatose-bisphosphate aldolase [Chloroflexi bacterium CG07_land_8_20_14_0_80_45_17]
MKKLSIGKIKGLQQLANGKGIMAMCALDHRGSLMRMLGEKHLESIGYQTMVDFKLDLCRALAPHASAILLDPVYGAGQAIAAGILPRDTGLLVSLEETGYSGEAEARVTDLLPDWNVKKIKKMGATGAKLLLYYRPDIDVARRQLDTVLKLAGDCLVEDMPFVVEPVSYKVGKAEANPQNFARIKPRLVIETAKQITAFPIDVLKSEFPSDLEYEKDKGRLLDFCHQLNEASQVPWVILSAGVNFELFYQEVEIACQAGASGFLAGRALWQEATQISSRKKRMAFLENTVIGRLQSLTELANTYGTPWYTKLKASEVNETWYRAY